MRKKSLTKKGKERKRRICDKVVLQKDKTQPMSHSYEAILPIFKSFVLIFEQKVPQVHRIHYQISSVAREFLACFVNHDSIKGLTGSKLKKLDIGNNLRKAKNFYVGASTERVGKKLRKEKKIDTINEFERSVKQAFINTGCYMQNKFPFTNKLLMSLTGLDPCGIRHSVSYSCLKRQDKERD